LYAKINSCLDYSNIKYSKTYKNNLKFTPNLDQILIGILLGGASAQRLKFNAKLKFKQGILHKDYLLHLYITYLLI
jgi:hypothetical protein